LSICEDGAAFFQVLQYIVAALLFKAAAVPLSLPLSDTVDG
jgi:hypothetical protein